MNWAPLESWHRTIEDSGADDVSDFAWPHHFFDRSTSGLLASASLVAVVGATLAVFFFEFGILAFALSISSSAPQPDNPIMTSARIEKRPSEEENDMRD